MKNVFILVALSLFLANGSKEKMPEDKLNNQRNFGVFSGEKSEM